MLTSATVACQLTIPESSSGDESPTTTVSERSSNEHYSSDPVGLLDLYCVGCNLHIRTWHSWSIEGWPTIYCQDCHERAWAVTSEHNTFPDTDEPEQEGDNTHP